MLKGCIKRPLEAMPSPREVALWASGEYDHVVLLESGQEGGHRSRYTIVGYGCRERLVIRDPLNAFEEFYRFLRNYEADLLPHENMVFGYMGYEAVASEEPWLASRLKGHEWPVAYWFRPETLIIYDNFAKRAYVYPGDAKLGLGCLKEGRFKVGKALYITRREDFERWVREVRRRIIEGEAFQVVISRVERYEYEGDPFSLYTALARMNPSPYMFFLKMDGNYLVGSSPELLVEMEMGRIETHPIAGTRPRGRTPEEDIELEDEMLNDPKEVAEHMMLVDLARNDLGKVAVPGTVRVSSLMDVEKYSHVQHIVSRVQAVVGPRTLYGDVLAAVFPAGTVTGAPKPRAMEIIAELEDEPRGPYAGAVGMAGSRAGETAIVIRSAWLWDNVVEIRAGAGIVYDSRPSREYRETEHKLEAVRRSLGIS